LNEVQLWHDQDLTDQLAQRICVEEIQYKELKGVLESSIPLQQEDVRNPLKIAFSENPAIDFCSVMLNSPSFCLQIIDQFQSWFSSKSNPRVPPRMTQVFVPLWSKPSSA